MKNLLRVLFTNDTPTKALNKKQITIDKIIERESAVGGKVFSADPDVTEVKYFFLPDEQGHKWYYQQTSPVRSKNFTNSYLVTEFGIEKSSTFFDEQTGRTVNVSTPVDESEARNLLTAAKKYYAEVTGKVYVKKPASRLLFRSKSNDGLAA
jgi:hypothetical protein